MEFWNSILTEKSWNILIALKKEPFHFVVIGGWAAYLWTKQHKSKDIDIVLLDLKDLEYLKQRYTLQKNTSLKKYEIKFEEIDLDIYVPYYSQLTLPLHEISSSRTKIEGIDVVAAEVLLILKQGAELDRKDSVKGQKDRVDIMTLLYYAPFNFQKYRLLLEKHRLLHFRERLKEIVRSFVDLKYLGINAKDFAKRKKEILAEL
jgi:hypothetical protein